MPPPPGIRSDASLNEADVGFGSSVNFRGVEADFAAAAEGHALRRGDDRLWRIFDGKIHVLELLHGHVEFVPLLLLRTDENKHEICADGKVGGLIGNDHGVEIGIEALDAFVDHGDEIGADGVHLGMEFAADNAVAEIDEAGAGIAFHFPACVFETLEDEDAGGFFDFGRGGGGKIENRRRTFFRFVKTFAAT